MTPKLAFIGKKKKLPNELAEVLGRSSSTWNKLTARIADDLGAVDHERASHSPKYGWSLKLTVKKRNILCLSPCSGSFHVSFILGDRTVKVARESKPSAAVLKLLNEAPRYAEGTDLCLAVISTRDIPAVIRWAKIKLAN